MGDTEAFEWMIVELMGHRILAGRASEVTRFGATMLRLEIDRDGEAPLVQFYGAQAIYCLTPTDEATVRARWFSGQSAGVGGGMLVCLLPPRSDAPPDPTPPQFRSLPHYHYEETADGCNRALGLHFPVYVGTHAVGCACARSAFEASELPKTKAVLAEGGKVALTSFRIDECPYYQIPF